MSEMDAGLADSYSADSVSFRMSDENVSYLLARVAELISDRADRRMQRLLRKVS